MPTQKKRTGAADEVNVADVKVLPISNEGGGVIDFEDRIGKREVKMVIGNIGTGNISTLATFSLPPLGKDRVLMRPPCQPLSTVAVK